MTWDESSLLAFSPRKSESLSIDLKAKPTTNRPAKSHLYSLPTVQRRPCINVKRKLSLSRDTAIEGGGS